MTHCRTRGGVLRGETTGSSRRLQIGLEQIDVDGVAVQGLWSPQLGRVEAHAIAMLGLAALSAAMVSGNTNTP